MVDDTPCHRIHAARIMFGCPRCDAEYADQQRRAAFAQIYSLRALLLEARDLLTRDGRQGCDLAERIDAEVLPWSTRSTGLEGAGR